MAQIKISGLPASAAALAAMQLEVNNDGTSERLTVEQLLGLVGLLATGAGPLLANIDATTIPGSLARFDGTTTGTKPAGVATGTVLTVRGAGTNNLSQFVVSGDGYTSWFRACVAGVWGDWFYSLSNLDKSTQGQAETGTDNNKYMTPLTTRQAFNATGSAPVYAVRAWGNFNGDAITTRASGNLSIARTATGEFTFTMGTAMSDTNYSVNVSSQVSGGMPVFAVSVSSATQFTVSIKRADTNVAINPTQIFVQVVR